MQYPSLENQFYNDSLRHAQNVKSDRLLEGASLIAFWHFRVTEPSCVGLRRLDVREPTVPNGLPQHLFARAPMRYSVGPDVQTILIPSPRLAQRITAALLDGWLVWEGSPKKLVDVPKRVLQQNPSGLRTPESKRIAVELGRKGTVIVEGGYVGGRYNSNYTIRASIRASDVEA